MSKGNLPKPILTCVLLSFFATCSYGTSLSDIDSKQSQLKNVSGQIQELKKSVSAAQWEQTDLQDQLKISELKIDLLTRQMEEINVDLKKAELDLSKTKASQQVALNQLDQQRALLADQVRILYQLGQKQSLKTLLNPDDIHNIDRHLTYYRYLNQEHLNTITGMKSTLNTINNNLELMTAQETNLKTLLQQKKSEKQQEQQAQEHRQSIINRLGLQLQDKQQQLTNLGNNQRSLQDTLDGLLSKSPVFSNAAFAELRGKLDWPIEGKVQGIYSANDSQKINGVIITAPEGTPVKAIYGGKVIFANWLRGFGLLVIINHGDGFMSLYARNHALYAKVGDIVNKNDVIAKIGSSGGYDKSSLYFEIRRNGSPVDPRHWCA